MGVGPLMPGDFRRLPFWQNKANSLRGRPRHHGEFSRPYYSVSESDVIDYLEWLVVPSPLELLKRAVMGN
jgi:hypothetical protein